MLSAYELERLENIRNNAAVLKSLGLESSAPRILKNPLPSAKRRKAIDPSAPGCKSSRLAEMPAPAVYIDEELAGGKVTLAAKAVGGSTVTGTPWSSKNRSEDAAFSVMESAESNKTARVSSPSSGKLDEEENEGDEEEGEAEAGYKPPVPESPDDLFDWEQPAFEALLAWKRARAKEMGLNNPAAICHNRTLCELVRLLPKGLADLTPMRRGKAELPRGWGIGTKRVEQHGQLMLDALAPFLSALRARHPNPARSAKEPRQAVEREAAASITALVAPSLHVQPTSVAVQTPEAGAEWQDAAGHALASEAWRAQRDTHSFPSCEWTGRRERCARITGCAACARYVADGRPFDYAVQSQKLLDVLSSDGAYGSPAAAHAAGWRWHMTPNHGSSSHAHKWWPPQSIIDEIMPGKTKLPLGTNAALHLLDAHYVDVFGVELCD